MQLCRIDTKVYKNALQAYKAIKSRCALAANQSEQICFGWTYYYNKQGKKQKLQTVCKPQIHLQ